MMVHWLLVVHYCYDLPCCMESPMDRSTDVDLRRRGVHSFDHHSDKVQCAPWRKPSPWLPRRRLVPGHHHKWEEQQATEGTNQLGPREPTKENQRKRLSKFIGFRVGSSGFTDIESAVVTWCGIPLVIVWADTGVSVPWLNYVGPCWTSKLP